MKKIVYLLFLITSLAYSQDIKWDLVKEKRKIYLTLNPSKYRDITMSISSIEKT